MDNETEKRKEWRDLDENLKLEHMEEARRLLDPTRGKAIGRTIGIIAIVVGFVFICVAITSDSNIIFRVFPGFVGISFIIVGIGKFRGVG